MSLVKLYAPVGVQRTVLASSQVVNVASDGSVLVDGGNIAELLKSGYTTLPLHGLSFMDDFVGAQAAFGTSATLGSPWLKKIVGAAPPTVAGIANAQHGQFASTLLANSEKEDAILYQADQLNYDATKGVIFECRAALTVAPTGVAIASFGLASAWVDGPLSIVNSAFFQFTGGLVGAARVSDNSVPVNAAAAITLGGASEWHVFRIDFASSPGFVLFFVDDVQVAAATSFPFTRTGASALLQPYASMYKASGTDVGTLAIDYVKLAVAGR